MDNILDVDWGKVLSPDTPLLEIFVRGSALYLIVFALLRFVQKRQSGTVGMTDLLVLVLIADAAQNAMADDYSSITDGILLVATIIFWSQALDWLGYRIPAVGRFVHPPALPLVEDGRINVRNCRKELITEEELLTQLRLQGVEDVSEVRKAYMEGNGQISVVRMPEPGTPATSGAHRGR